MSRCRFAGLALCALLAVGVARAQEQPLLAMPGSVAGPEKEGLTLGQLRDLKRGAWGHPNELWRFYALEAVLLGRHVEAARHFQHAALYADKYSQHRLSLIFWEGKGRERDRAQGYVWADLAAERGYRDLLLIREKMWSELGKAERDAVPEIGSRLYAKFGDDASKPRLEQRLKYALTHATGSRTGFELDRLRMLDEPGPGTDPLPGNFWARERWEPEEYWKDVDAAWGGYVEVHPLVPVERQTPDAPASE